MNDKNFGRIIRVTLDDITIDGMDVRFRVNRSLSKDPNEAEIAIFNLSEKTRALFQRQKILTCKLEVGYVGKGYFTLYSGDLRKCSNERQSADWVTTVETADGDEKLSQVRINEPQGLDQNVGNTLVNMMKKMGLGEGNVNRESILSYLIDNGIDIIREAYTTSGKLWDEVDRLAKAVNKEISIQNGTPQLLDTGTTLGPPNVYLTPETGLIESPQAGKKGLTSAKALIQQNIVPGRRVIIDSEHFTNAVFRVEKVTYTGSNFEQAWYADMDLLPLASARVTT